jgi:hypothetical protein
VPSASSRTSQAPWSQPATAPADAPPRLVVKTRPFDGILTGLAASAIAGVIWWGVSVAILNKQPDFELWHAGAALVGLIVGCGVLVGSRRGGLVSGFLAVVFTVATILVTVYFIDRSQTILVLADAGRTSDIPLWQGVSDVVDTYQRWWDYDQTRVLMWIGGPLVAALVAGWPGRRPIGG